MIIERLDGFFEYRKDSFISIPFNRYKNDFFLLKIKKTKNKANAKIN